MIRAAIAIGSNSTRLLTAEKRGGSLVNIHRGREETRLFLGLDENGNILPKRLEETAQAVLRLYREALAHGAESAALFATSACRDAKNGPALRERIRELTGLDMQIISGEEEARLAFRAAAGQERRLVTDIGGGSTELTLGEHGVIEYSASAQMGASRLLKMRPICNAADAETALAIARETLNPYIAAVRARPAAPALIGLGGTCTTAASIERGKELHGENAEGLTVTVDEARRQLTLLSGLSMEERERVPGLPAARAAHMPNGLCILIAVMEGCGFASVTVSGRTNLDGYLLEDENSVRNP